MGFVGNYVPCGLSPQTDGMPVIQKQAAMTAAMPYMETEIQELAGRTAEKLKKLTEEEFDRLVFLPAEDME